MADKLNHSSQKSHPEPASQVNQRPSLMSVLSYLIWLSIVTLSATRHAAAVPHLDDGPPFRTGAELEQKLNLSLSVSFTNVSLREELIKFSRHEGIGIFIDRRIDPNKLVTLNMSNVTFEKVLWKLAQETQLGVCRLGDLYYFGPPETAEVLPSLWFQMKTESEKLKRRSKVAWVKPLPLAWPLLSEPEKLLTKLAKDHALSLRKSDDGKWAHDGEGGQETMFLPHDLWPEIRLPDLSPDEQLALLVIGFGLWFERNGAGNEICLIPFPSLERGQAQWQLAPEMRKKLPEFKRQFSECQFSLRGQQIRAAGPIKELAQFEAFLVQQRTPQIGVGQTYSLSTFATREQILSALAERTGRTFEFAPGLKRTLDERIELKVKDVDLQELIRQTLLGTDLSFDLDDKSLLVR